MASFGAAVPAEAPKAVTPSPKKSSNKREAHQAEEKLASKRARALAFDEKGCEGEESPPKISSEGGTKTLTPKAVSEDDYYNMCPEDEDYIYGNEEIASAYHYQEMCCYFPVHGIHSVAVWKYYRNSSWEIHAVDTPEERLKNGEMFAILRTPEDDYLPATTPFLDGAYKYIHVKLCCANDRLYSSGDDEDPVWVRQHGEWVELDDDQSYIMYPGAVFRTEPPSPPTEEKEGNDNDDFVDLSKTDNNNNSPTTTTTAITTTTPERWASEFTFKRLSRKGSLPGSESFDHAYLDLLARIRAEGTLRTGNRKPPNYTLAEQHSLEIDLHSDDPNVNLMPVTTLRKIGTRVSIVEALWYLRGEDNIHFLRDNGCHFWDDTADKDGYLGMNYGLLTNFPPCAQDKTSKRINQLQTNVIDKLCGPGKPKSRNMQCVLYHPGTPTKQASCTSCVQFAVRHDETLDMTICQKSSDTIVGLPHDVVAWAVIYHLVRREVKLVTKGRRILKSGKIYFDIAAGGAHVYDFGNNVETWNELLEQRSPKLGVLPELTINSDLGMFELANKYTGAAHKEAQATMIEITKYTKFHPSIKVLVAS